MMLRSGLLLILLCMFGCAAPAGMVRVPGGDFFMGSDRVDEDQEAVSLGLPDPWYVDEHPYRKVALPTYFMDRTEVTSAGYQAFVDANPDIEVPYDWPRKHYPTGAENDPVVYVTWHDAVRYCRWRGGRLPTEAEWEKAARGTKGNIYPWGNTFDPGRANISTGPFEAGHTHPVGTYPGGASPYGILDMIGNVWEWTADDYRPYPASTETVAAFSESFKVVRGLSFEGVGHYPPLAYHKVIAVSARASFRGYDYPTARLRDVGFRCVQDAR